MIGKVRRKLITWYGSSGLKLLILKTASRSRFLAGLWFLFKGSFGHEQRATIAGRYQHLSELVDGSLNGAVYTLRRNTHRLEKGLIMRPRRPTFALNYIGETVQCFVAVKNNTAIASRNNKLVEWATDVLTQYFDVVEDDQVIGSAREKFDSHRSPVNGDSGKIPYVRDLSQSLEISIEQLKDLAIRRRSCRWFQQKPVPRELIDKAVEVGCYAPSACNRQPFEFLFFDDPELVGQVAALPGGTAGFYQNFPCILAIVGDFSAFPYDRDRHVPYIDASLAAMGLQFALEVQGISSCCINWPDIPEKEEAVAKLLNLKIHQRVIMMMAIGYPDPTGKVPFSQKKSLDEIRQFNEIERLN